MPQHEKADPVGAGSFHVGNGSTMAFAAPPLS